MDQIRGGIILNNNFGSTARVKKLRNKLRKNENKHRTSKELSILNNRELRNKALIIRKAHAFSLILEEMPVYLDDDELIVGGRTLLAENKNPESGGQFSVKQKFSLKYYPKYAKAKEKNNAKKTTANMKNIAGEAETTSHSALGFQRVLNLGFGGIKKMAKDKRELCTDQKKINFYSSVIIIMDSISKFISKYSKLVAEKSENSDDKDRKKELKTIAENCKNIAVNPPDNFWQALQLFYFSHLFAQIENMTMMSLGRFDQYLYPYYKKDLENNNISRAEAQELLECLWIKLNDTADISTDNGMHVTLSGLNRDGYDATNELSYMCIDATMNLKLVDPKINVRFHKETPADFISKCCQLTKLSMGYPAIFNDETIIKVLKQYDFSIEDARDYCTDGCSEVMIPGRSDFYPVFAAVMMLDPLYETIDMLGKFENFDELLNNYKINLKKNIKGRFEKVKIWEQELAEISPVPFLSSTLIGCLESGKDKTEGGTVYNHTGAIGSGFVNTVNSLAALKEFVFEKKLISQIKLKEILKNNFKNAENLRQILINLDLKFGNDIDEVDTIGIDIANYFSQEVLKYNNSRGGKFLPGFFQYQYVIEGKRLKATPDGRRDGDPLANNLAPYPGTGWSGPTAALKSVSKIDPYLSPLGTSVDVKISRESLDGENGSEKLAAFFRAFIELGGMELQLNTVSSDVLKEAQNNPDNYRDLVVRVWGFNAYFISLTEEYQNYIIKRTEHSL